MNELLEEVKAHEALNHISDGLNDILDGEGAQENEDIIDEGLEDIPKPTIDFNEWYDDDATTENLAKTDGSKFRPLELLPKEELMAKTKTLVPEQMVVLQKVLDMQGAI